MTFNKKITLITAENANGSAGIRDTDTKEVWANVEDSGINIVSHAQTSGYTAVLTVVMWKREYSGQSVAMFNGKRYRIREKLPARNCLHIKLVLSKEG